MHNPAVRTGSNDPGVRDVFVPEEETFSFQDLHLSAAQAVFYAFHFMFIAKGPVATLGIARHSISRRWEASAALHARCAR